MFIFSGYVWLIFCKVGDVGMVVEMTMCNLNVKGHTKNVELFWNLSEVKVVQEVTDKKKRENQVKWGQRNALTSEMLKTLLIPNNLHFKLFNNTCVCQN